MSHLTLISVSHWLDSFQSHADSSSLASGQEVSMYPAGSVCGQRTHLLEWFKVPSSVARVWRENTDRTRPLGRMRLIQEMSSFPPSQNRQNTIHTCSLWSMPSISAFLRLWARGTAGPWIPAAALVRTSSLLLLFARSPPSWLTLLLRK